MQNKNQGCTVSGIHSHCIYSHARWELQWAIQVSVIVFLVCQALFIPSVCLSEQKERKGIFKAALHRRFFRHLRVCLGYTIYQCTRSPEHFPDRWTSLWNRTTDPWTHLHICFPARARTDHSHCGLPLKRLEKDLCWIILNVPPTTKSVRGMNWTELKVQMPQLPSSSDKGLSSRCKISPQVKTDSCPFCESAPAWPVIHALLKLLWRDSHIGSIGFKAFLEKHFYDLPRFLLPRETSL